MTTGNDRAYKGVLASCSEILPMQAAQASNGAAVEKMIQPIKGPSGRESSVQLNETSGCQQPQFRSGS